MKVLMKKVLSKASELAIERLSVGHKMSRTITKTWNIHLCNALFIKVSLLMFLLILAATSAVT